MEHITADRIERDADEFKRNWNGVACHWFKSAEEADLRKQYDRI